MTRDQQLFGWVVEKKVYHLSEVYISTKTADMDQEMRYFSTRGGKETLSFEDVSAIPLSATHTPAHARPGRLDRSRSQRRVSICLARRFSHWLTSHSLYIPTHIPALPKDWKTKWAGLSFPELSHEILSLFVPTSVIPSDDLQSIINTAYSSFRSPATTPIRQTGDKEYVLELWHGPTWAFKDVALQFLGELFRYFLERRNKGKTEDMEELTVVGATSGDTGR